MNSWNKYGVIGVALNDYRTSLEVPNEVREELRLRFETEVVDLPKPRNDFEFEARIAEASAYRQLDMIQWMIG